MDELDTLAQLVQIAGLVAFIGLLDRRDGTREVVENLNRYKEKLKEANQQFLNKIHSIEEKQRAKEESVRLQKENQRNHKNENSNRH